MNCTSHLPNTSLYPTILPTYASVLSARTLGAVPLNTCTRSPTLNVLGAGVLGGGGIAGSSILKSISRTKHRYSETGPGHFSRTPTLHSVPPPPVSVPYIPSPHISNTFYQQQAFVFANKSLKQRHITPQKHSIGQVV